MDTGGVDIGDITCILRMMIGRHWQSNRSQIWCEICAQILLFIRALVHICKTVTGHEPRLVVAPKSYMALARHDCMYGKKSRFR